MSAAAVTMTALALSALALCAHAHAHAHARGAEPPSADCVARAKDLCDDAADCGAFGIYGARIQLHNCGYAGLVKNADWTIYVRSGDAYTRVPGNANVNEESCPAPHLVEASCAPPPHGPTPPPAPTPAPAPALASAPAAQSPPRRPGP